MVNDQNNGLYVLNKFSYCFIVARQQVARIFSSIHYLVKSTLNIMHEQNVIYACYIYAWAYVRGFIFSILLRLP